MTFKVVVSLPQYWNDIPVMSLDSADQLYYSVYLKEELPLNACVWLRRYQQLQLLHIQK